MASTESPLRVAPVSVPLTVPAPRPQIFQVFAIADFADRMATIRGEVSPWLAQIGEAFAPPLSTLAGEALFPHVARHARRTVNPPEDTWVAFGPRSRGYKADPHFKVAVSGDGIRFLFEAGPELAGKGDWAARWQRSAGALHSHLSRTDLAWFKNEHDAEPAARLGDLSRAELGDLAGRLLKGRDGQLVLGLAVSRAACAPPLGRRPRCRGRAGLRGADSLLSPSPLKVVRPQSQWRQARRSLDVRRARVTPCAPSRLAPVSTYPAGRRFESQQGGGAC